jgi:multicomponent Na+:H+ antiporter subunit E
MGIFFVSTVVYLFLAWSGDGIDVAEILIAVTLGAIMFAASRTWISKSEWTSQGLNPLRWGHFFVYFFGPFFLGLTKANLEVAKLVITGKIRPGIVKINPRLKTPGALTLLANSITLTPGTLTVDVNEREGVLYIHWLDVLDPSPSEEELYGSFGKWARRIAE